jgi:hypothetical protein
MLNESGKHMPSDEIFPAGTGPASDDPERAAAQLLRMYGREKALERARELQEISAVRGFAEAVSAALERMADEDAQGGAPGAER